MANEATTLNLDGVSYSLEDFSDAVKNTLAVFNAFAVDLQKEEVAVLKTRAAMDHVRMQLVTQVKAEVTEKGLQPVESAEQSVEQ